jgi:hypothetical protein
VARTMRDTTEVYRAVVRYHASWKQSGESTDIYGPYDGPAGRGQAKRRISDQFAKSVIIEAKVQKLGIVSGVWEDPKLEWVDVDD